MQPSSKLFIRTGALIAALIGVANAQEYPGKPARIIVGYPPGGANDIVARIAAQKLSQFWTQQFVVENRPGASGVIGTEVVARAAPDGYTLGLVSLSPVVLSRFAYAKLPYDSLTDFAPITPLAMAPMLITVHPALPAANLKALIALAKTQPGKLDFAVSGSGGMTHMVLELFKSAAGVNVQSIVYKGASPALTDTLAGQVQGIVEAFPALYPTVKQGRLRGVAVSSERRMNLLPEVPTAIEQGVPALNAVNWFGIVAPARTPRAVVDKLHAALTQMNAQADVKARYTALGLEPMTVATPDAYAALIKTEIARWGRIAQQAGVKPQ